MPATSSASGMRAEAREAARLRLGRLFLARAREGGGDQRANERARHRRHVVDGTLESFLVGLGRHREAAQLAHELQRGVADLELGGGWLEVEEGLDVSAHGSWACMSDTDQNTH